MESIDLNRSLAKSIDLNRSVAKSIDLNAAIADTVDLSLGLGAKRRREDSGAAAEKRRREDSSVGFLGDGRYWRRGELLGQGSFGSVFAASCKRGAPSSFSLRRIPTRFPIKIAVKSADLSCSKTLRHERTILDNFSGFSGIVQCGAETTRKTGGTQIYNILLEYCSGGTLADKRDQTRGRGIPEPEVKRYTRSIVEALAKICDFGVAKGATDDRQKRSSNPNWHGNRHGTLWFMSPESFYEDCIQEPPCDIWSLGIMVLEMLTGHPAWDTNDNVLRQIEEPDGVPKIPAHLSPEAITFLHSCLKRMPLDRGTAKSLLQHPFISGIKVGPRSRPENIHGSCIHPSSQLNPKILVPFD